MADLGWGRRFAFAVNEWRKRTEVGEPPRTDADFVEAMGTVGSSTVQSWRDGKQPNQEKAEAAASILGVDFFWLYLNRGEAPAGFAEWYAKRKLPTIKLVRMPDPGERSFVVRKKPKTAKRHQR